MSLGRKYSSVLLGGYSLTVGVVFPRNLPYSSHCTGVAAVLVRINFSATMEFPL
jgi:hypothetical protein